MFYIILKGKVSVWLPVPHAAMKKPLAKFKARVLHEVAALNRNRAGEAASVTDLEFRAKELTSKRLAAQQADAFFKGEAGAEGGGEHGGKAPDAEDGLNFVSYEDFAGTADPSWTPGKRRYEWNRLVLDKA